MTFEKKGRPAEDRLARQREIYEAVIPLIVQDGARRLSMRQAAQVACLSIGGLYYYFPTKRELVAHVGFCRPAIHAALELGAESFWEVVETLLTGTEQACEANLQRLFPAASDQVVQRLGRAIRRVLGAALLDKSISPDELRDELRILVDGYGSRAQERMA